MGTKWPICPEQFFFGTNHYHHFHLPIGPFHCAKFTKNSYSQAEVVRIPHFWAHNGPFTPNNFFFFWKIINIIFIYWPLSLCKISLKSFHQIQSYEDVQFLGIKWPICSNENFFRKTVNEPCSFHSCLSTCQKSK